MNQKEVLDALTIHKDEARYIPKGIDKGSQQLTSVFNTKLFGEVADLGAGWGYLSKEALTLLAVSIYFWVLIETHSLFFL